VSTHTDETTARPAWAGPRSWLARAFPRLLAEAQFRRYWTAQSVSMLGDQISGIAIPFAAVLVLHAGSAQMGYLTALEWLPSLLFGLHAGAMVDRRGSRRAIMIAADLGRFALLASLPACYLLGVLTLAQLLVVTFLAGTLSVFFSVSDSTLFVSLVREDQYVDANSLVYGSRALSFVAGPSIGGLLVQVLSAPIAILADALSYLGSALFLHRVRAQEPPPGRQEKASVTAGARFIAAQPVIRAALLAIAIINFFYLMSQAVFLLYVVRDLHVGAGELGLLLGAASVGGVLGATLTKRITGGIGVGWSYALGCQLFTAPLAFVALAGGPRPAVLAMLFASEFCIGFGAMLLDISLGSMFAVVIPDELRARVSGAFQAINYGARPVGALAGGLLGAWIGLRPTIWVAVAGGAAGALLLLRSPAPRFRMPVPDGDLA
jgi:MFS family permease